jgi:hypothetical protein
MPAAQRGTCQSPGREETAFAQRFRASGYTLFTEIVRNRHVVVRHRTVLKMDRHLTAVAR